MICYDVLRSAHVKFSVGVCGTRGKRVSVRNGERAIEREGGRTYSTLAMSGKTIVLD